LVCVTSPRYFASRFCGQEYYLFDERRRAAAENRSPPAVILPIIWVPAPDGLPSIMNQVQWQPGGMPELYQTKGLRYLKILAPADYKRCVVAFGEAIRDAWRTHPAIPPLQGVAPFENIPNTFAGPQDAALGPQGYLPGPGVACFVYAAGRRSEIPQPPGRYGATAAEWRPYLPPERATVAEIARSIASRQSLSYREIPVDDNLPTELSGARERKNLTLVVADPCTLPMQPYRPVTVFDGDPWEGTAVLMPWDGAIGPWDERLQSIVRNTFPVRSQAKAPPFQAPIPTVADFERTLDLTLTDLRAAITRTESEKKQKTDGPPPQVVGPSGAPT
jgi:FxsC-like protein